MARGDAEAPQPLEPFHIRDRVEHEAQSARDGPLRRISRIRDSIMHSGQKKDASADSSPVALEEWSPRSAPASDAHSKEHLPPPMVAKSVV